MEKTYIAISYKLKNSDEVHLTYTKKDGYSISCEEAQFKDIDEIIKVLTSFKSQVS